MSSEHDYTLVALVGLGRCPTCSAELITKASFTAVHLSLDQLALLIGEEEPWINISISDSPATYCPFCQ